MLEKVNVDKRGKVIKEKMTQQHLCVLFLFDCSPCNHLLLLIGRMATATQNLCWC